MLLSDAFRRLLKESTALVGLLLVLIFFAAAIFAPVLSPFGPNEQDIIGSKLAPPSVAHWLGADILGRDMLSRMLYGARISVFVGLAVVAAAGSFGTLLGLFAGYRRGWIDEVVMRVTDIFFAFPPLILAMAIAGALGPSLRNALIAVVVVLWPVYARLVRGQVLSLRESEYIQAAQVTGVSNWKIITRHLLPNTMAPLLVQASFDMGTTILTVAG
ncbi:MAG: ABC transporter permease, partial [Caldilineaceae bacterium]|nr:ABC transporter permease [Caldilineaceae bacterium]